MKVLFVLFAAVSAALFSFTIDNLELSEPDNSSFAMENVLSTELLDALELDNLSAALNGVKVIDAKEFTMKDGGHFLEYTTIVNGDLSTYITQAITGSLVPPCHCGPGADGIYNAWWEGLTPYQYNKPYCLLCAVKEDDAVGSID